jgi:hypothetical protein
MNKDTQSPDDKLNSALALMDRLAAAVQKAMSEYNQNVGQSAGSIKLSEVSSELSGIRSELSALLH